MKKFFALILAGVLMAMTCVPVLAAPSISVESLITGATVAGGNGTVTLSDKLNNAKVTEPTAAEIAAAVGNGYTLIDTTNVTVTGGTAPYTITFAIPGVTTATEGFFLHYNGSSWDKIAATFGNGTATGTFNSLSPVAIVIKSSSTSPKTGANTMVAYAAFFGMVALAGAAVVYRRKDA